MTKNTGLLSLYIFLGVILIQIPIVFAFRHCGVHSGCGALFTLFYLVPFSMVPWLYERGMSVGNDVTIFLVLVQALMLTVVTITGVRVWRWLKSRRGGSTN